MHRTHQRGVYVAVLIAAGLPWGCARSETQVCADGLRCPVGASCVQGNAGWTCSAAACGNGVIDTGELCDGSDVGLCVDYGFHIGRPLCGVDCGAVVVDDCRVLEWSEQPSSFAVDIEAVWASARDDLFAVTADGRVLRSDGEAWRREPEAFGVRLTGLWGASEADVFAVGEAGTILRFDGGGWEQMTAGDSALRLEDLSGVSGEEVYAVAGEGIVLRYDGGAWEPLEMPDEVAEAAQVHGLHGVFARGPGEVFAVGGSETGVGASPGVIVSLGVDGWTLKLPPLPVVLPAANDDEGARCDESSQGSLRAIWGAGDTLIAVGTIDCRVDPAMVGIGKRPWIVHYEAGAWRAEPISAQGDPDEPALLHDVWGTAPDHVFAVGTERLLHYDGRRWTEMSTARVADLRGVWGSAADDVYAVGEDGAILRFRGASLDDLGPLPLGVTQLEDVWGRASDDVFAVGSGGFDGVVSPLVVHHDGLRWKVHFALVDLVGAELHAVHGFADGTIVAVGELAEGAGGLVLRCGSEGCERDDGVIGEGGLRDVWGPSAQEFFAVGTSDDGERGVIARRLEGEWSLMDTPAVGPLWGVWGTGSDDVVAVGDGGALLRYDGREWREVDAGLSGEDDLRAVWGGAGGLYVGGARGLLLRRDGGGWTRLDAGSIDGDVDEVWGLAPDDVFALVSGAEDALWRYDGLSWAPVGTPFPGSRYRGMGGVSDDRILLLVGDGGAHRLFLDAR